MTKKLDDQFYSAIFLYDSGFVLYIRFNYSTPTPNDMGLRGVFVLVYEGVCFLSLIYTSNKKYVFEKKTINSYSKQRV